MPIKWAKYTYRIARRRRALNGPDFTCDQLVNGYVCGVDLHDSNRPWPIGIHKYGKRWILTDLISGIRVRDFTKRPTEVDLPGCMWLILKYWERRSKERGGYLGRAWISWHTNHYVRLLRSCGGLSRLCFASRTICIPNLITLC